MPLTTSRLHSPRRHLYLLLEAANQNRRPILLNNCFHSVLRHLKSYHYNRKCSAHLRRFRYRVRSCALFSVVLDDLSEERQQKFKFRAIEAGSVTQVSH